MPTITKNRRRHARHEVSPDITASVEFDYPRPNGRSYRLRIVNISPSGLSFSMKKEDGLTTLDEGASLPDTVVHLGDCRIRGELLVMHVTPDADSRYLCGALFYPATDTELVKLKSVIAGMEVAGTD
jgi:hypothetical protein